MRENFIFYRSFRNAVQNLPITLRDDILKAIFDYALDGIEPNLDLLPQAIFEMARPQIDANNQKYINGKKGGAPIGNQNARKQPKTTQNDQQKTMITTAKQRQPNDNDNDNDNDNVNVNENDNENDDDDNRAIAQTSSSTVVNNDIELFNALDASGLFTDKEIQQIIDAFSCSTWLRKNITSPQKIAKLKSKIISGYYRDYAELSNDRSQDIITADMDCGKYEAMGFQIITDND